MKRLFAGLALLLLVQLISSGQHTQHGNKYSNVSIVQADSVHTFSAETDSVSLSRHPFTIRFFAERYESKKSRFHAFQLAALSLADSIHAGMAVDSVRYFSTGTGLASEMGVLFITDGGHHYIYYESEEDKRANLLSHSGKYLELELPVRAFYSGEKGEAIQDSRMNSIWLIAFYDQNDNHIIDPGELHKIKVKFK